MGAYFWEKLKSQKCSTNFGCWADAGQGRRDARVVSRSPFRCGDPKGPEAGLEKPSCPDFWHMAQGQNLQQGRATQGVFPGDKPIPNFSTMLRPSWACASLCLPALVCRLQLPHIPGALF